MSMSKSVRKCTKKCPECGSKGLHFVQQYYDMDLVEVTCYDCEYEWECGN